MTARLTSRMLVTALLRRVQAEGGNAAVLAKGDENAGGIVLICAEKGRITALLERMPDFRDGYRWTATGPQDLEKKAKIDEYLDRRRARDPDLWLVELDIASAERFAAETIASG
jgi:hypothetical protein